MGNRPDEVMTGCYGRDRDFLSRKRGDCIITRSSADCVFSILRTQSVNLDSWLRRRIENRAAIFPADTKFLFPRKLFDARLLGDLSMESFIELEIEMQFIC